MDRDCGCRSARRSAAGGQGRHVKQSGATASTPSVTSRWEPLAGRGLRVRRQGRRWRGAAAVHPECREGRGRADGPGRRPGHPVVDIRVTLPDGKAHSVDSSDMAFQRPGPGPAEAAAARQGLSARAGGRDGRADSRRPGRHGDERPVRPARPCPGVRAPSATTGALVRAEVPQIEISRYAIDLRAFSHGAATFTRSFVRYEPMPENRLPSKVKASV